MLRVTGGALAYRRPGVFVNNATIGGKLLLWTPGALTGESEMVSPPERDALKWVA